MSNFDDTGYFDDTGFNPNNFTWWNTTTSTSDNIFFGGTCTTATTAIDTNWRVIKTPDKDWMPYDYVEYEPRWHQKFASYKNQMEHMWN